MQNFSPNTRNCLPGDFGQVLTGFREWRSRRFKSEEVAKNPERVGAFTLIELLAVVAIIGVLAALIFAGVGASTAKARDAACLSNLRQLAVAFSTYASEHDGLWPAPMSTTDPDSLRWCVGPIFRQVYGDTTYAEMKASGVGWWNMLQYPSRANIENYTGPMPKNVLVCPAHNIAAAKNAGVANTSLSTTWGYGMNTTLPPSTGNANTDSVLEKRPAAVAQPSRTMLLMDNCASSAQADNGADRARRAAAANIRHKGRNNVLFCDGHIDSIPNPSIPDQTNRTFWYGE